MRRSMREMGLGSFLEGFHEVILTLATYHAGCFLS